jgi:phage antirepressor YoqD-like protein
MESLQIILADGRITYSDKLHEYFISIFRAEDSGEEFPVELSHVWPIGYSRKDNAVAALRKNFVQGVDYVSLLNIKEREVGTTTEEIFSLSVSCAEWFAVRVNREVFEIYRACRQVVRRVIALLPDFTNPVAAARAWADEREAKELAEATVKAAQEQLAIAAPKIAFTNSVDASTNAIPFADAANWLKIPALQGRNKLVKRLKKDKILLPNRRPYQQYINSGYFELKPQTYKVGKKEEKGTRGERITNSTRVTPKGLRWLAERYSEDASL